MLGEAEIGISRIFEDEKWKMPRLINQETKSRFLHCSRGVFSGRRDYLQCGPAVKRIIRGGNSAHWSGCDFHIDWCSSKKKKIIGKTGRGARSSAYPGPACG
jgi:hypothetical protein